MNTIFKTIYNEVLGAWVAVSEITKTGGKKSKNKMLSTAIIVTIAGGASVSFAQTTVPDNKNNVVDGGKSVAVGEENKVYGGASLGFGTQNLIGFTDAKAGNALVAGFRNISTANYSTAIGSNNMSTSVDSLAFGKGNFTGDFTKFSAIRTKAGTGANQPGNGGTWNALETKLNETVAKYNLTAISAANLKEMQAIGVQNLAINLGALAFGNRNISAGQRSIAIGNESVALKNNSTALGYKNLVNGIVANAFGAQNTVEAHNGLAVGVGNKVTGLYGISIGNASVTGADLTTLQNISTVSGVHSISLGNSNAVKGQYALVVGKSSRAYLDNSIAIGSKSISKGLNSTAIGSTAQAMNASSLAVGHNAISLGDKSVSIGNAQSLEKSTTAIGSNAKAWVFHSTAIGNTSEARGESSLAVGQNNKSYVAHSFSAGDWNSIKGRYAGSFGYHNNINNHGSYSYGNENTIDSNLSMAIGSSNNINSSADRTFILGRGINATHQNSVILGNKSESKAATAISSAKISGLSVTSFAGVGNAEYGVVSVGSNIKKEYFKDDLFTKNGNDPALKKRNSPEYIEYLAKIAFKKQELIKARLTDNPDADISDITDDYAIAKIKEGDANFKEPDWTPKLNQDQLNAAHKLGPRQIVNVAAGAVNENSTDAINGSQLFQVAKAIIDNGIKVQGDAGNAKTVKIGETVRIEGNASWADTDQGNNIATNTTGTGIMIGLKKALTGMTSGDFGGTVINADGVKVADNIKLADAGLIVGSVVIQPNKATVSGLQNPTANDEAVNLGYLTTKLTDLTNGGIKFTGNDGGDHTLKLGQKITIKGTANYADTDGGANIATQASDGQLLIGLKKALTGLTSFTTEGGTVLDDTGLAVKDGPSVKKDGIDAGGKKISNLKPAGENSADNDAANVKFVKDAVKGLTDSGYTLKGDADATQLFKVGSTIAFTGDANITSTVSANGISLALKPDLTGLTSGTFGDTVINGDGVKVADNIKLADDGLTAGNVRIDPASNKITGLEAPTDDKDAVNKKFLDDAVKGLADGGIKFTGNDGGDHTLALGQKITIKGTANYADTDGGANIATQASDGQLLIGLKKALTGLTSVAIENGPTLSNAGIDAGGKPISNLKPATDTSGPNDAANVQYVKDKVDALKNEGYTLTGDSGTTGVKPIGSSIAFTGDANLTTTASNTGVAIALNKSLQNMQSVAIANGPILNADGLKINDKVKLGSDGLTAGNVRIDPTSNKISGIEAPTDDKDAANKKYVDDHITNLNNNPLTFETNDGSTPKKLGDTLKIKGSDSNATKDNFDLSNIMTWIDENGVLRIGIRKSLELSSIKASDGAGKSATLNPDSLVFEGVDGKNGADGTVTMKVTTTGPADVKGNTLNRLSLNDVSIATLNDGFKYAGNVGGPISVTLNQTINIQGATANTNAKLFDGGKNVMTEVAQDGDGVKYTVAIKKSPEFENVTLTGTPAEGSTVAKPGKLAIQDGANKDKIIATVDGKGNSEIALKGASDKDIVKIGADSDSNGKVSVIGKDGANSTDLKHDGLAINDVSGTSNLGTNAQGTGGVEDLVANASAKKRRLTHTVDGKTEEIATLNDGLIVKGNTTDKAGVKLNNAVKVAGADSNTKWEDFDGGENIMTKVETVNGETVIRVAMKKDLKLKDGNFGGDGKDGSVTVSNGDGTETVSINPDKINFTGVPGKDGQPAVNAGIQMSQDVPNHVDGTKPATRLQVVNGNQVDHVATMNDGLKFSANTGEDSANKLNTTVNIKGDIANTNWSEFDDGRNIMTKIEANEKGETDITVALKRDIAVDTAVVGTAPVEAKDGQPAIAGKDGNITVVNKNGKTAIVINSAGDTGPEIAVNKPDSAEGTKLTTNGLEISKNGPDATKPTKAVVSIAPNGVPSVSEDASSSKPRLTLASGGKTESIATMNDGLKFQGDVESVDKLLSNTLTMVGGETDEKKLTTVEADKNIGVIVKDVADAGSRAPADKVMQVRLAKKLKGLESAEFKPVDAGGNATGQSIMIGAGGVTVTKGGNTASFSEDGLRVGENGPSMTSNGINAGGMPVTNVGTPIKANDAATKGYVDAELAKQQNQLGNNIEEVRKDALGASAMAIATAGLPQAYIPGKSAFAVAGGAVKGHSAFAMGISTISDSGKWILKGTVSGDGRTQVGGSIGAAYQW
ncbi:ESPR-type extended signal peptide-containing protein [Taylorella equigenitalis]|uniref:ESPR-type extended signal peptide-containing protein n=1 Tax=Taylorella equigenitalis TaxID=29575 RepID=UPI00240D2163|nr:YadA-like family protein [Taylorella equigenitalis]WFE10474.1 YadA-like family protein [Taylorella equigenitalis]WFE11950.1 YadA-like family protein [Taylorella equigenitalis]WGQ21047.1 YadA-like family protein [Taylorella equigenitalis]WGU10802.1 YadA-like family protein [Taylorella equigenitalis]